MYQLLIDLLSKKPELYEQSTAKFWDDEHISGEMLKAHLDPTWDAASRNHTFIAKSVDWITQIAPPLQYRKLLDLGCGPGLYAESFHTKGYEVTGIDYSHRSLDYARNSALQNGSDITYIYQDYLELLYQEEFDVITLIYCDFSVMSENNRNELLKKIFKALKPGGKLILDVTSPKAYEGRSESRDWYQQESGFWNAKPHVCINSHSIYPDDNTRLNQTIILMEDKLECYNIWDHIFTESELRMDLNTAGFYPIALYGDIAGADYNTESKVICAVATKGGKEMELSNIIKTRRSARSYKATAIPENILSEMLEAARLAPSPGNSQSTYYGVIQDTEIKEKLARAAGNQMWIAQAPVVFVCCADLSWDIAEQPEEDFGLLVNKLRFNNDYIKYLCEYPHRKARTTLFENAAPLIGAEHIILTGTAHGLSSCIVGFLDIAEADKVLQLPEHITCLYLLPIGYAAEAPCDKNVKQLEEIVFYNLWQ